MKKSELLVDYCQRCGAEIGSPNCCKSYTCTKCDVRDKCLFAFDPYNTNGDCLATK